MRSPSKRISPAPSVSSPATTRSKVDLPLPKGPRKAMNSRGAINSETPSSTRVAP
jgi:hypothetical protein